MITILRGIVWKRIIILFFFLDLNLTYPEEVCKLFLNGFTEDLMDQELVVPENTVVLSECIKVRYPSKVILAPPPGISIFFIVDNSLSMTNKIKDRSADRFTVIHGLIDSIMQQYPNSEVGLAVFKQDLEFDIQDSPYFVKPPKLDGAYLKLMQLNSTYDNNQKGSDIIKKYLESEIDGDSIGKMKYKPTDPLPFQLYNTNINSGFDAAKHAMKSSRWEKHRQFIIFISDGEANQPQDGTKNDFAKSIAVPTTLTIFFPKNERVPLSLQLLTENVKKNGYSTSNPLSQCWCFYGSEISREHLKAESKQRIMRFLMNVIFRNRVQRLTNISVNGLDNVSKWGDLFYFKESFPLTGSRTDFSLKITYTTFYDSITRTQEIRKVTREKSDYSIVTFSVIIDKQAKQRKDVLFKCWDRKVQFYHNNTPVDIADETMKELEIRFIEDKIDILYGYENVFVDIGNTKTPRTDLEKFKLEDKGSYFSHIFKRECKSTPKHGDTKLTHAYHDSIIATFRNPVLPLDTLRYGIPFRTSGITGIKNRQRLPDVGRSYTVVDLTAEGVVNPYDRNNPEKHKIPSHILEILKEDNATELKNSTLPNTGILLRVIPQFAETIDKTAITDIFLKGNVTIFDPTGNTVIEEREMGFHENKKTLYFVWNGRNTIHRTCGTGSYLAVFKVRLLRGHYRKNVRDSILKLIVGIK